MEPEAGEEPGRVPTVFLRDDSRFGTRMTGQGTYARQIRDLFATACRRHGLGSDGPTLAVHHVRLPGGQQLSLFSLDEG